MTTRDLKQSWITGVFVNATSHQNKLGAEIIPSLFSPPYRKADCFSAIRQATLQIINSKLDYCLLNY